MRLITAAFVSVFLFSACASAPKLSPQQRRALQMRTFDDASYDNVFRAFKTVLQDEGYIIKNMDMKGGLILANIQKTDSSSGFWAAMAGTNNYRTGEGFEVSVSLEAINKSTVETRVIIQKLEQYSLGGKQGREIVEPTLYRNLYQKVMTEVERRKAQGRG